jgi:hypothetical protein
LYWELVSNKLCDACAYNAASAAFNNDSIDLTFSSDGNDTMLATIGIAEAFSVYARSTAVADVFDVCDSVESMLSSSAIAS